MSKLDDIIEDYKRDAGFGLGSDPAGTRNKEWLKDQFKEVIRDLMANTIKEMIEKESTSAIDYIDILKQKVKEL